MHVREEIPPVWLLGLWWDCACRELNAQLCGDRNSPALVRKQKEIVRSRDLATSEQRVVELEGRNFLEKE